MDVMEDNTSGHQPPGTMIYDVDRDGDDNYAALHAIDCICRYGQSGGSRTATEACWIAASNDVGSELQGIRMCLLPMALIGSFSTLSSCL